MSFDAKRPISSVRTIDKTMSDGHERASHGATWPRTHHRALLATGPKWLRRKSRPLRRPPPGLSVCAHMRKSARMHAPTRCYSLAIPPLPSRCASWRAVHVTSVYLMHTQALRAAATLLVISYTTPRVRTYLRQRASADAPAFLAAVGYGTPQTREFQGRWRAAPTVHARRWVCARD